MTEVADSLLTKKVCMLGTYAVGKTSLVRRYVEGIFSDRYLTTVGVKIDRKQVMVGERGINLILWDLSGDDELRPARPSYLRGTAGYILVADGCRRTTADRAESIQRRATSISGPVPVVVAVNKADLKSEWEIGPAEIQQLGENGWPCLFTSAKSGHGVEALFLYMAEKMLAEMDDQLGK
jgi:small GTP-binding protein